MDAIKHFKGERTLERFYSDRSGEIDRALRDLRIAPDHSQPGVPQKSAVCGTVCAGFLTEPEQLWLELDCPLVCLGICLQTLLCDEL